MKLWCLDIQAAPLPIFKHNHNVSEDIGRKLIDYFEEFLHDSEDWYAKDAPEKASLLFIRV